MPVIAVTNLTSGSDTTDQSTPYTTGTINLTVGTAIFVWWEVSRATSPPLVTVTGFGLTWAPVGNATTGDGTRRMGVSYAVVVADTALSGAVTLTPADSVTGCAWVIDQVSGGDLVAPVITGSVKTGNNGGTPGTTLSLTLNAAARTDHRPYAGWAADAATADTAAPQTNWTETVEAHYDTPAVGLQTQWRSDSFSTAAAVTWTGGPFTMAGVAFELAISRLVDYEAAMREAQLLIAPTLGSDISITSVEDRVASRSAFAAYTGVIQLMISKGIFSESEMLAALDAAVATSFPPEIG